MTDQNLKPGTDKKQIEEKEKKDSFPEKKDSKSDHLNKKNEELGKEIEIWKAKYIRALADYQNLEKRVSADRQENVHFASKRLLIKILEVLDIFDAAEKHSKDGNYQIGLTSLRQLIQEEGVEKIEVLGKKFDPLTMECVEVIGENAEIVTEELRKGYLMHGKVIRVAMVKVGKKEQIN